MKNGRKKHVLRGALAGMAGGLVASWVMNEFIAGPGEKMCQSLRHEQPNQKQNKSEEEDATMKVADAIVEVATGGRHLSHEGKKKGGPIVHYSFGALMGALYGGVAELGNTPRAGLGTVFGSVLFAGADLVAVPALNLSPSAEGQPVSSLISPFAAHLVYGSTTELVRRALRPLL